MYQACMYCAASLGANEVIARFPVGRQFAFDAAKGRLWVICPRCARWNLSPIEERWEAVEDCERRFRGQRLRAQTDNIGLATVEDDIGLVRIGAPLRPEFAAWRYGRELARRRSRRFWSLPARKEGGSPLEVHAGGLPVWGVSLQDLAARTAVISLKRDSWRAWEVSASETLLLPAPGGGWDLSVGYHCGRVLLTGREAEQVLARLLAKANASGARKRLVSRSVDLLLERPGAAFLQDLAHRSSPMWEADQAMRAVYEKSEFYSERAVPGNRAAVGNLATPERLALEMALHEATEQAAIEGDLSGLEAAWREAEEIARISDNLLVPLAVEQTLEVMRNDRPPPPS